MIIFSIPKRSFSPYLSQQVLHMLCTYQLFRKQLKSCNDRAQLKWCSPSDMEGFTQNVCEQSILNIFLSSRKVQSNL